MTGVRLHGSSVRRQQRLLAMGATALLLAGMTCSPAAAATTVAGWQSVLASGQVTSLGRGIGGVSVVVFARPTSAAMDAAGARGVRLVPLGAARSSTDGGFVVGGALSAVPATHVGRQGQVDVDMVVSDRTRSITWS